MIRQHQHHPRGMTLIETMVAMAISAVLILGAITMYNGARNNYRTAEQLARLQENLRFATDTLEQDVRLAGFWGRMNDGAALTRRADARVQCALNDVTDWAIGNTVLAISALDDTYSLDCPGNNPRDNSDVLVVRHAVPAGNTPATPRNGVIQVQTSGTGGEIFGNDIASQDTTTDQDRRQVYDVAVNAYYVSNISNYDDDMPSLRRRTLVGDSMQDQEIIAGVENLQVLFGIDRNQDGELDGYVDPGDPNIERDNIIAVRLWVLVRGDNEAGQGYVDDNEYVTPDGDGFVIRPNGGPAYNQAHRRYAFTKTIVLDNRYLLGSES